MRFETKALLLLVFALVVGLSAVNFLSVAYLKFVLQDSLEKEIDRVYRLYLLGYSDLPDHIRVGEKPIPPEGFKVARYTGKHFIFLKEGYTEERLRDFSFFLLMWEAILVIVTVVLFQRVVVRYIRREQEVKDLMSILLLAITHRIGNFISAQKVNLELLEEDPVLDRLKESVRRLERDYRRTLEVLEELKEGHGTEPEVVDLKVLVERVIRSLPVPEGIELKLRLSQAKVRANPVYLEIMVSSLLENALRYANSVVHVRLCGKGPLLVIRNDVRTHTGGSGMGLQIVKFVARRIGAEVRFRIRNRFTAVVVF